MKDYKLEKEKHLTIEAREEIQACLDRGVSFKDIARRVGKSPSTISREVKKHIQVKESGEKNILLGHTCPHLLRPPFVCNPCEKRRYRCSYRKQFYNAKVAHQAYKKLLGESRDGLPLTKQAFFDSDEIITKQMKKGQRLYHIMQTCDIAFSKSSAYRHLHNGYLSITKTDFPRVVKFKARKQYRVPGVPKSTKVGRTYDDFLAYTDAHEIHQWVEMDTLTGRVGGKAIMTLHFTQMNFMFGLLLDNKSAAEAAEKVRALKAKLYINGIRYGDIVPILLTDNGSEFSNVSAFVDDSQGIPETRLFFCNPYCSSQKPRVEKNHTLFRDIVPKGTSFDCFTQEDVNIIFSHVNSVRRKVLNGKCPYDLFAFIYGEDIAHILGISRIADTEVIQDKLLLRKITRATSDTLGGDPT